MMAENKKFLKTIYELQNQFGVSFEGVGRTFSFGLKPNKEEEKRLEEWFRQVGEAKKHLYSLMYKDFMLEPGRYLGKKFDYATFFAKRPKSTLFKAEWDLITSQPVMEGLRTEINGTLRSFSANHKRIFDENKSGALELLQTIEHNEGVIEEVEESINSQRLKNSIRKLEKESYEMSTKSRASLLRCQDLVLEIDALAGEYNYELNQIEQRHQLRGLQKVKRLKRLPAFPSSTGEGANGSISSILKEIEELAEGNFHEEDVLDWIGKEAERAKESLERNKRIPPMRRFAFWLQGSGQDDKEKMEKFLQRLNAEIGSLRNHYGRKQDDAQARSKFINLLSLRARLVNPESAIKVNILRSNLAGEFLRGKEEKEVITLPGFSWSDKKPRKNVTFAFIGVSDDSLPDKIRNLCICIASSVQPFSVREGEEHSLLFIKTEGGSRKKSSWKPKTISYLRGSFNIDAPGLPMLLPVHFGKSQARRYLINKNWGLLSKNPSVFLMNARLKRERTSSEDVWRYFLDTTMAADQRSFGFKEFQRGLFKKTKAVVGIDRGEVNAIAYAVVSRKDGSVLKKGLLAEGYNKKLEEYFKKKQQLQSEGKTIPKWLRSKISRLQKTTLEQATSEILNICAEYRAAVSIEDLARGFGAERSIIPKRVYATVEKLITNALEFSGLVRVATKGNKKYWGLLIPVFAYASSRVCQKCGSAWVSNPDSAFAKNWKGGIFIPNEIYEYSEAKQFENINTRKFLTEYKGKILSMNRSWEVYSRKDRRSRIEKIESIETVLSGESSKDKKEFLGRALSHRPNQKEFICHACGFTDDADINAAVEIARRGLGYIERSLTKNYKE